MSTSSIKLWSLVVSALCLAASGCSTAPAPGGLNTLPSEVGVAQAIAEIGSIESVISLDAVVSSQVSYQVTAPISGSIFVSKKNVYSIRNDAQNLEIVPIKGATFDTYLTRTDGVFVAPLGMPIIDATFRGFVVTAEVSSEDILRIQQAPLLARVQLRGGGAPFDCPLLDPYPSSSAPVTVSSTFTYSCLVPADQRVIVGMTGRLAVVLASREDVITLPIEAVAGTVDTGQVTVKSSKGPVTRTVTLGISDGVRVEILDGLAVGDVVLLPNPGILPVEGL